MHPTPPGLPVSPWRRASATSPVRRSALRSIRDYDWLVDGSKIERLLGLVSPYFFSNGGTVIDWMPPDFKPGNVLSRPIRGNDASLMIVSPVFRLGEILLGGFDFFAGKAFGPGKGDELVLTEAVFKSPAPQSVFPTA